MMTQKKGRDSDTTYPSNFFPLVKMALMSNLSSCSHSSAEVVAPPSFSILISSPGSDLLPLSSLLGSNLGAFSTMLPIALAAADRVSQFFDFKKGMTLFRRWKSSSGCCSTIWIQHFQSRVSVRFKRCLLDKQLPIHEIHGNKTETAWQGPTCFWTSPSCWAAVFRIKGVLAVSRSLRSSRVSGGWPGNDWLHVPPAYLTKRSSLARDSQPVSNQTLTVASTGFTSKSSLHPICSFTFGFVVHIIEEVAICLSHLPPRCVQGGILM